MPGPSCTSLLAKTTSAFCTKEEKRERNYDKKTTKMKKAYVKLGSLSDYQWACHPCLKGGMRKRKTIPMKNCDSALEFKQFFYMKTVRQKKTKQNKNPVILCISFSLLLKSICCCCSRVKHSWTFCLFLPLSAASIYGLNRFRTEQDLANLNTDWSALF